MSLLITDPLAYFLTWTTYGTWLPGDDRGWTDRSGNIRRSDPGRERITRSKLLEPPCVLSGGQREQLVHTFARVASYRGWTIHAASVRSNHVHLVITAPDHHPDRVIAQLKTWATRDLRAAGCEREHFWTTRGSARLLLDDAGLEAAIRYVNECQDQKPPPA